ncbi:hypothetical protein B4U80_10764, partial [Leptotrombidium deliense]
MLKKLRRNLSILFRIRSNFKETGLRNLYYLLFSHIFDYGITVWGFTCETKLSQLKILQKKILRTLCF